MRSNPVDDEAAKVVCIHKIAAIIRHPDLEPSEAYALHLQNMIDENRTHISREMLRVLRTSREHAVAAAERIYDFLHTDAGVGLTKPSNGQQPEKCESPERCREIGHGVCGFPFPESEEH